MSRTKITGSVLANTAVTAGVYGGSTQIPTFNVDAQGRLISAGNSTPSIANTQLTGLITGSQLENSGATAGIYGGASTAAVVTVNSKGLITGVANTPISISFSSVSGLAASATTDTTNATNITSGTLAAGRLPAFTGDATSSAGSSALTLANSGVTAGIYGGTASIPVVTVNAKGLVTSISNTTVSGISNVSYNSTSGILTISTSSGTNYTPDLGIGSAESPSFSSVSVANNLTVSGNVSVSGNFTIAGNTTTVNSTNLELTDSLIYLAQGNSANVSDIGIVGHFTSDHYQHTGLVRDASDGTWKLFSNVAVEPSTTIDFTGALYDNIKVGSLESTGSVVLDTGTTNGVAYLNGSKVLTTGSALTFNGSQLLVGPIGQQGGFAVQASNANGFAIQNSGSTGLSAYFAAGGSVGLTSGDYAVINGAAGQIYGVAGSEQMRLTSTGLGIGTSSPAYKLDVLGGNGIVANFKSTGQSGVNIVSGGAFSPYMNWYSSGTTLEASIFAVAGAGAFAIGTGSSGTERMRIDSSGNLGLGVTPSAWTANSKAFQFGRSGIVQYSADNAESRFGNNYYQDGAISYRYITSAYAGLYSFCDYDGVHRWRTAPSGTAGSAISFTQAMTLDANGNLGIGTTSITDRLTMLGGSLSVSTSSASNNQQIKLLDTNTGGHNWSIGSGLSGVGNLGIYDATAGVTRLVLDSSGNLGLGVTPSAWYTGYKAIEMGSGSLVYPASATNTQLWNNLYVNASGNVTYKTTGIGGLYSMGGGGYAHIWHYAPSGTAGTTATLTQAMTLDASGNLSISGNNFNCGTSGGSGTIILQGNTTSTGGFIYEDQNQMIISQVTASPIIFRTSNSERMRIDSSGRLGISSSTPQAFLDVASGTNSNGGAQISVTAEAYGPNAISARSTIYDVAGTLLRLTSTPNSVNSAALINFNAYNSSNGATGAYIGATAGSTQNGPAHTVFGTRTGAQTWQENMRIDSSGNVGIGTASPSYKLHVNGSFAAITKSFVIDHPTEEGMTLRYGSLEGPENGVYVRGRLTGNNTIELPEYWTGLVYGDSLSVNLTPIGNHQKLYVKEIVNNTIIIGNENLFGSIDCFYTVFAERKDVDKLVVEE